MRKLVVDKYDKGNVYSEIPGPIPLCPRFQRPIAQTP